MNVDARFIVNALVNNTFTDSVCLVCLLELDECKESIFTKVCKEEMEYCPADILSIVFKIQFAENDDYSICPDCFIGAFAMYKFYLQVSRSQEVLNFYSEVLTSQIGILEKNAETFDNIVCVEIPIFEPDNKEFNIDIGAFASNYVNNSNTVITMYDDPSDETTKEEQDEKQQINDLKLTIKKEMEDDIIVVTNDKKQSIFYEINDDGDFVQIDQLKQDFESDDNSTTKKKTQLKHCRKQRLPMDYVSCNKCPIKYRFLSKLKTHMKQEHNSELFICKICKILIYNAKDYHSHLSDHNQYICGICGIGIKKRSALIAHIKRHKQPNLTPHLDSDSHIICEVCGEVLPKILLKDHYSKKHDKKFICFYCGKAYKVEASWELHIKKHESYHSSYKCSVCSLVFDSSFVRDEHVAATHPEEGFRCTKCDANFATRTALKSHDKIHNNFHCDKCSKSFVDARALMWHQRLHTGERPYSCDTCGRTFISANRRNQHAMCAHSEPTRRCPLCPALFHLRSMVNTHIRKVHLKEDQVGRQRSPRWNRSVKHRDVFWRTEVVPLAELSVPVQSELLQLQTNQQSAPSDTI